MAEEIVGGTRNEVGRTVYLGNGQMTGDESERLNAAFHARAAPTAGVGGTSEERQGMGLSYKSTSLPQTE